MASASLYKTPEQFLLEMIDAVQASGSHLTDFIEGSTTRTFYEGLAVALSAQTLVAEQLRLDSFLATATGDALTVKALDYQVPRKPAVQATGVVRITRAATVGAVTIPAGWGALVTVPQSGVAPVSYLTTQDAVFADGVATVDVPGIAVEGGLAGNVSQGSSATTALLAVNPVVGFTTDGSFFLKGPWTLGFDAEPDDQLRARVPLEVQARVKGKAVSFLAGALRVAGVTTAQVFQGGDTGKDSTTVPAGSVEVWWKGDVGLAQLVSDQVQDAAVLNQAASSHQSPLNRAIAALTVYCLPGTDTTQLALDVQAAVMAVVNNSDVGQTVRYSDAIEAAVKVDLAESVGIPFAQFRQAAEAGGTAHDIPARPAYYPSLVAGDCTVTVTTI